LLIRHFDVESAFNAGAFCDYMIRYRYIQGLAGTYLGDKALFDANVTAAYGAFAVTSRVLTDGGNLLAIMTNRYATSVDGDGFALSGGKTLSNFDQIGPRTFTFDVDTATTANTLAYVQQSSPDEFVSAGNVELGAFSGAALIEGGVVASSKVSIGLGVGI